MRHASIDCYFVNMQVQERDPAVINSGIKQSVRHFHMLGVIAPFAAASSGANTFLLLTKAMAKFLKVSWSCGSTFRCITMAGFCNFAIWSGLDEHGSLIECCTVVHYAALLGNMVLICQKMYRPLLKNWLPVQIYLLLLFLRVLLSWFPAFNWERQPWLALRQVQRLMQNSH